jgi:hypothetical protein
MSPPHGHRQAVRRSNLGREWPFRVDHGTIACHQTATGPLLLYSAPRGRAQALDRLAEKHGFPAVRPLGNGFGLGIIIGDALMLCLSKAPQT